MGDGLTNKCVRIDPERRLDDSGLVNMKMNLGAPLVVRNITKSLKIFGMAAPM